MCVHTLSLAEATKNCEAKNTAIITCAKCSRGSIQPCRNWNRNEGQRHTEIERRIGKWIHGKQLYHLRTYVHTITVGELRENIFSQTRRFISWYADTEEKNSKAPSWKTEAMKINGVMPNRFTFLYIPKYLNFKAWMPCAKNSYWYEMLKQSPQSHRL